MKITTTGGTVLDLLMSSANCTGYRASSIEITAEDIDILHNMVARDPVNTCKLLRQLQGRFAPAATPESELPLDYKTLYNQANRRLGQIHEVVRLYQDMPDNHILVQCPNKCEEITHQHFDYCSVCSSCSEPRVKVDTAALLSANPPLVPHRTIYLSGPMTGLPEFNYPRFNEVTRLMRDQGHIVYNPAEFPHHGQFPIRQAFAEYTAFICNRADTMVMLSGWPNSKGAKAERALAENCNLDIIESAYSDEDLLKALSKPLNRK